MKAVQKNPSTTIVLRVNGLTKLFDMNKKKDHINATHIIFQIIDNYFSYKTTMTRYHWDFLKKQTKKDAMHDRKRIQPKLAVEYFCVSSILSGLHNLELKKDVRIHSVRIDFILGQVIATDQEFVKHLKTKGIDSYTCGQFDDLLDLCVVTRGDKE